MHFGPLIPLFCLPIVSCAVSPPQHDIRGEEFFAEGGRILLAWTGEMPNDQFGWVASPLADANGDGVADILTCAPFQSLDGVPHGRVYLYSGKDGSLIRQHDGARGDLLGLSVSSAGDLDGDGCTDYAASATQPRTGVGQVHIWSGRTGELIRTLTDDSAPAGTVGWNFGREMAEAGDWNGDGIADLAVTAPQANTVAGTQSGKVQLRSGADGSVIFEIGGEVEGGQFGTCVAASDRPQGFDQPVLVVGAMTEGAGHAARRAGRMLVADRSHAGVDAVARPLPAERLGDGRHASADQLPERSGGCPGATAVDHGDRLCAGCARRAALPLQLAR